MCWAVWLSLASLDSFICPSSSHIVQLFSYLMLKPAKTLWLYINSRYIYIFQRNISIERAYIERNCFSIFSRRAARGYFVRVLLLLFISWFRPSNLSRFDLVQPPSTLNDQELLASIAAPPLGAIIPCSTSFYSLWTVFFFFFCVCCSPV